MEEPFRWGGIIFQLGDHGRRVPNLLIQAASLPPQDVLQPRLLGMSLESDTLCNIVGDGRTDG